MRVPRCSPSMERPSAVIALCGALLLQVVSLAPTTFAEDTVSKKNGDDSEVTSPNSDAKKTDQGDGAECNKEAAAIRKIFNTIPKDFRKTAEPIAQITERVVECKERLEQWLQNCSSNIKGNEDIYPMMGRIMVALRDRYRQSMRDSGVEREHVLAQMKEYYGQLITLSEKFRAVAPADHPRQAHVWRQTGDGHYYRGEYNECIEVYKKVLAEYPKYEDEGLVVLGLIRSYVNARRANDGAAFARKAIKEHYQRPDLPHYYELLWKLHTINGNLEALLALTDEIERIFPLRQLRKGATLRERGAYKRYLGYNGFRRGYCHFALGSPGDALDAFSKHADAMRAMRESLQERGESLPPELDVYSKRTNGNVRFLKDRYGRVPKTGLEEIFWAVGEPVMYEDAKKSPFAIIFRNIGDERSAKFLKELDAHAGKNDGLFKLVVLSFTRRSGEKSDPQADAREALLEAVELGIQHASVGIDPNARSKNPSVFEACQALVGSATFVVLDREARLRWWQQDPRDIDVEFSTSILERIALE